MKKTLFIAAILFSTVQLMAQDVLSISGETISLNEFENTLMKNNRDQELTKEYLDDYVQLFINYKLKVKQAKEIGLDKNEDFVNELEVYRIQLAKPYLKDNDFKEGLINEAYQRMRFDVNASHILFRVEQGSTPSDTLKKYNLASTAKSKIENREITFEEAVSEYSEETYNNGNLGYFTAFDMVYSFETAAYTTKIGEVSNIIRTKYGYHLVKVNDKRDAFGEVKVSHIMFKFPKGADADQKMVAKLKADEVYNKLENGEEFFALADRYSEDRSTAVKGGSLPWFGLNKMAKQFEDASFSIENIGEYTQPFLTDFGWHIVILDDKKVLGTLEETRGQIVKAINKGSRSNLSDNALVNKVKEEYNFTEHRYIEYRKNKVKESIDFMLLEQGKLTQEDLKSSKKYDLFTLGGIAFTSDRLRDFIYENQEPNLDFNNLYNLFVNMSCVEYEESKLEEKFPEYKTLLNEFRDGILLFELTGKKVWTKAMEDTVGLKEYFEKNRDNYWSGESVDANIYICANKKVSTKLKRLLWQKGKNMISVEDILEKINKTSPLNIQIESDKFFYGDNKYIDYINRNEHGVTEVETDDESVVFVEIELINESVLMELSEGKGKVISDYQNYLEEMWISELRDKYIVEINLDVLYTLIK